MKAQTPPKGFLALQHTQNFGSVDIVCLQLTSTASSCQAFPAQTQAFHIFKPKSMLLNWVTPPCLPDPNFQHYLVEPFHDHVWEVFVQHRWWDDDFIKRLIVTPDSKVSGILLLAATKRGVGIQRRKGGAGDERAGQCFGMQKHETESYRDRKNNRRKNRGRKY